MHRAKICSAGSSSAKPDGSELETRGSGIYRGLDDLSETIMAYLEDWRTPLVRYLEKPGHTANRKVRWPSLKYVMLDNTLYHRTINALQENWLVEAYF
jgi:hypothetical protein